jgi:hypothetical protein
LTAAGLRFAVPPVSSIVTETITRTPSMNLPLLRQSLTSLRERFAELQREGNLRLTLAEYPVSCDRRPHVSSTQATRIPASSKIPGKPTTLEACYRRGKTQAGGHRKATPPSPAFSGIQCNQILDSDGQLADHSDCGAVRTVRVEGENGIWERFQRLAADAGVLLGDAPQPIRTRFARETLDLANLPLRWVCAMFDLAWAKIPGSPMHPEIEKSVAILIDPNLVDPDTVPGQTPEGFFDELRGKAKCDDNSTLWGPHGRKIASVPDKIHQTSYYLLCGMTQSSNLLWPKFVSLSDWPDVVRKFVPGGAIGSATDPRAWFSTLADAGHASVCAIDILLTDVPTDDASDVATMKEIVEELTPTARLAYLSYVYASQQMAVTNPKDEDAHKWLKERAPLKGRGTGDLSDYDPPGLESWTRYLRTARQALGEQKHKSRTARNSGSSIVRSDEID